MSKMRNLGMIVSFLMLFAATAHGEKARILRHLDAVPGRWIVLIDRTIAANAFDGVVNSLAATYDLNVTTRWPERTRGFICDGASDAAISRLADDPRVELIEQDFHLVLSGTQYTAWNGEYLWHLDRLDEPTFWTHDGTYDMCPEGRSVYAYVLDTGVRTDHEQFNLNEPSDRVVLSRTFDDGSATGQIDTTNGCSSNTNQWHGTAVASVLAGTTIGASKTQIVSLRVFDCFLHTQLTWLLNALHWIRSTNDPYAGMPGVVNLSSGLDPTSLSGDISTLTNTITGLVTGTGIPFFTAADNFAGDACQFTPASLAYTNVNHNGVVFTVGGSSVGAGSDQNDYRWQTWNGSTPNVGQEAGSNGGRCVSVYAPGCAIYHAENASATAYDIHSGTSFSSPLAAGIAARYMERTGITNYTQVYDHLLSAAASTGTPVNNVNTLEYWLCRNLGGIGPPYWTSTTYAATCPSGYVGLNGSTTPVHMPATFNESNAGMIYSDMTCP